MASATASLSFNSGLLLLVTCLVDFIADFNGVLFSNFASLYALSLFGVTDGGLEPEFLSRPTSSCTMVSGTSTSVSISSTIS